MSSSPPILPPNSLVLVTGAAGYVGSHVSLAFLQRGFRVRGTARDLFVSNWILSHPLFEPYAQSGAFELVCVPDLAHPHAFDSVLPGVDAVVHVAALNKPSTDLDEVAPPSIEGLRGLLKSCKEQAAVKRFVYTASSFDAAFPAPRAVTGEVTIGRDTWNEAALQMAKAGPLGPAPTPEEVQGRAVAVYVAAKLETHRALWRFVEEESPAFAVNSVAPYMAIGQPLHGSHLERVLSIQFFKGLSEGQTGFAAQVPTIFYTHVRDLAALHVAAVLDPDVAGRRIHAWAAPMDWNDGLAAMRRVRPEGEFVEDIPGQAGLGKVAYKLEESEDVAPSLLRKWARQDGWTSLDDGVKEMLDFFDNMKA